MSRSNQHAPTVRSALMWTVITCVSFGCSTCRPAKPDVPAFVQPSDDQTTQTVPTRFPAPARLAAIGDLHGDVDAARNALQLAGAIDGSEKWIGGDLVVVQTGDVLDRGDTERDIIDLLSKLKPQAEKAGGALITLAGNHEFMNMLGNLDYVTPRGFTAFSDMAGELAGDSRFSKFPLLQRARAAAFSPGGPLTDYYSDHNVISIVGDTVFVHAGVLPSHATYGVEKINEETRKWILGARPELPDIMDSREAPIWTRRYSVDPEPPEEACADLTEALATLKAKRMVVGHTIQEGGISSACDEKVWRIDVGMSSHYGATSPQVLQIKGSQVETLSAT